VRAWAPTTSTIQLNGGGIPPPPPPFLTSCRNTWASYWSTPPSTVEWTLTATRSHSLQAPVQRPVSSSIRLHCCPQHGQLFNDACCTSRAGNRASIGRSTSLVLKTEHPLTTPARWYQLLRRGKNSTRLFLGITHVLSTATGRSLGAHSLCSRSLQDRQVLLDSAWPNPRRHDPLAGHLLGGVARTASDISRCPRGRRRESSAQTGYCRCAPRGVVPLGLRDLGSHRLWHGLSSAPRRARPGRFSALKPRDGPVLWYGSTSRRALRRDVRQLETAREPHVTLGAVAVTRLSCTGEHPDRRFSRESAPVDLSLKKSYPTTPLDGSNTRRGPWPHLALAPATQHPDGSPRSPST